MHYLNQDESVFHSSPEQLAYAISELFELALQASNSFRLEFDSSRLSRVIGEDTFAQLMPKRGNGSSAVANYDVSEDRLDPAKIEILRRIVLSPDQYSERPLNYIKSIRLLDAQGNTVLRGGDRNTFILFSLPDDVFKSLIAAYSKRDIPPSAIEEVEVDVNKLKP